MSDLYALRSALANYSRRASPSVINSDHPCTVDDLNRVIRETKELISLVVEALDRKQ